MGGLEPLVDGGKLSFSCNNFSCRRSIIAQHFGEVWESAQCDEMCDNCKSKKETTRLPLKDYVKALKSILMQAESMEAKLTGLKLVNALMARGEGKFKIPNWSPPKTFTKQIAEQVILHLLIEGYLKEDFAFTPYSTISYIVRGHVDLNFAEDGAVPILKSFGIAKSSSNGEAAVGKKRKAAAAPDTKKGKSDKKAKTELDAGDLICLDSD